MTVVEFEVAELNGNMCQFTFEDGNRVTGVISDFFDTQGDENYYFLPTNRLIEFYALQEANDWVRMRGFFVDSVDISSVVKAERIH